MPTRRAEVTIAASAAVSSVFDLAGSRIVAVIKPATWTAADISFEVETGPSSGTYVKVVDRAGALYKLTGVHETVAECMLIAGDANQADIVITSPGRARVVSTNTASEANLNQAAARSLTVLLENVLAEQFG